jgi:hypothetical protein
MLRYALWPGLVTRDVHKAYRKPVPVAVHKSLKTSSNPCQPSTNPTNPANPTQTHKLGRTLHRHPELGQRVGPDREEANVERALEYAKECSGMTVDAGAAGQGGRARGAARGQVGGELVG